MELHDNEVNVEKIPTDATNLTKSAPCAETTADTNVEAIDAQAEAPAEAPAQDAAPAASIRSIIDDLKKISADAELNGIDSDAIARIKQQFYNLHNEALYLARQEFIDAGNAPEAFVPQPNPDEEEFKALMAEIKDKKAKIRQQLEAQQLKNLELKKAIIDEINSMSADTDNVNRHYPRAKELQNEFKAIGEVPQQNATDIWKAFQDAVEHFYDQWKVNKELRDYDFKKNLAEKQLLLDEARQLDAEPDVVIAFKRLQELHEKWREIGPVDKEHREEIWAAFKDASAAVNKRYQAFFEQRKQREQENEAAKDAICARIEAIDTSKLNGYSAWNKATKEIIEAQEQWKKLGYASRKSNNTLFSRFRKCCDDFFAAKAAFFNNAKDEMAQNLQAKTALCEQAEALMQSTDWKATTDQIVQLQKQWKTIGAVQKKYSDQIWTRFLAACDHFFQQKKQATSSTRHIEQANLATKRQIVERLTQLNSPEATEPRAEAIKEIHALRAQWQQTGHVPFREKDRLHDTYRETVRQLFDKYDIHENRARQASFIESVEEMSTDKNKLARERERLARALETRRSELHTYENNMGFFNSKTKTGDSMLRELENKIQRIKNDITQLEDKIRIIDSKIN